MSTTVERIRNEARSLPLQERETLLAVLDCDLREDSPDHGEGLDTEAAWDEEIRRRLLEVETGSVALVGSSEMEARLEAIRSRHAAAE